MLRDIQFIGDHEILMHKTLFSQNELALAKCLNFEHDENASAIKCDLTVTSETAIIEFIKESFQRVWNHPSEAAFKEELIDRISSKYGKMQEVFYDNILSKLGYEERLYYHQKDSLFLGVNKRCNFYALEQGLGKTLIAGSISKMLSIRRTVIICPASLKHNWMRELCGSVSKFNEMYFSLLDASKARTIKAFQERFVICNYDSLEKWMDHILSQPIGHIIIDECFCYNTLIHTNKGLLKIGDIVEKRIVCNALSWCPLNNVYLYKPIVNRFKKYLNKRLVKIKYGEKELVCTETHQVWTHNGFKRAKELLDTDSMLMVQTGFYDKNQREEYSSILFEKLQHAMEFIKHRLQPKIKNCNIQTVPSDNSGMRNMSEGVCRQNSPKKTEKKILWCKMFGNMENEQRRDEVQKSLRPSKNVKFGKKEISFKSNVSTKNDGREKEYVSRASSGSNPKDVNNVEGEDIFRERGKWATNKTAIGASQFNKPSNGICYTNRIGKALVQKFAKLLQSRFSLSRKKNSNRSRWENSQIKKMEVFGSQENGSFKFVRVDSIEILERGSGSESEILCPANYVYDIEVKDNHNYFADNILVHNCTAIKSTSTNRFKRVEQIIKANPDAKVSLLSGTPVRNRINDLFAYLKITGHPLGVNYAHFLREYTISSKGRGNSIRITGAKNTDLLWMQLSNFMIRKRKDECLDLPSKIYGRLHFGLDDYKEEYNKAVKEALENSGKTSLNSCVHSINIVTSKAKLNGVIEFAESIIDQGEKVVIFTGYTEIILALEAHFKDKCVLINGSVNSLDRSNRVDRFMTDETCMVFLGNTLAAGTGLTLTVASNMIFCDLPFSPADLVQAEDRLHRISQTKAVNIYYAMAIDSIDDHLYSIIADKAHDASKVIDNHSGDFVNQNVSEILISKLREQYNIPAPIYDGQTES